MSISVTTSDIAISCRAIGETGSGMSTEVIPSIQSILNIFDPMILPTARSDYRLRAATTEVMSSGSDVPTPTTINLSIASKQYSNQQ